MYKFPYYTEADTEKVIDFMKKNSFASIIGHDDLYPVATHIPLEVEVEEDGKIFLSGHLMKKTDHHIAFSKNENVLVIFSGPHAHISASWYTNPVMGSTWNYMVVHAKGKIRFKDEQGTYEAVKAITNKYESPESAASFDKLPQEYVDGMVKAIVGFTIEVESFDNTFKLSQNRDKASRENIIAQLRKRPDGNSLAIADEMEKLNTKTK
jgi:transcriptional regulator